MSILRKTTFLILFLCLEQGLSAKSYFDQSDFFIEFFRPSQYLGGVQVWASEAGENDVVFFASDEGLSVYDGMRWISPQSYGNKPYGLRSLFYDRKSKRLYCGGDNLFGYWSVDRYGQFVYHQIYYNNQEDFKIFWRIGRSNGKIYFCSHDGVCRYDPHTGKIDHIETDISNSFVNIVDSRVYIQKGNALYELVDFKKRALPFRFNDRVMSIIKDSKSDRLFVFRENSGIFTISRDKKLSELSSQTNMQLHMKKISSVTETNEGDFIVGTVFGGIYWIDQKGRIKHKINVNSYKPSLPVLDLCVDTRGNIWAGAEGGIAKIGHSLAEHCLMDYSETIGDVYAIHDMDNQLYYGTNKGVYLLKGKNMQLIPGAECQTWNLQQIGKNLLVCNEAGMLRIIGGRAEPVFNGDGIWALYEIPARKGFYIGASYHGFDLFELVNGQIIFRCHIKGYNGETRVAAFDKYKYLWCMVTRIGYYRFTLSNDLKSFSRKLYKLPDVHRKYSFMFKLDNDLVYYFGQKAYRYDIFKDSLVVDEYAQYIAKQCGETPIFIKQFGNYFWYINKTSLGYITRNLDQFSVKDNIFSSTYNDRIPFVFQKIEQLSDSCFAYGLHNKIGLYKICPDFEKNTYAPHLTAIEIFNDRGIAYADIERREVNLSAYYSALKLYFNKLLESRLIEYKIENYADEWKLVKIDQALELPHLPAGRYTVLVRNYNQSSNNYLEIKIMVKNPWYLSYWMFLGMLTLIGLIIYLNHLRHRHHVAELLESESRKRKMQEEAFEKEKMEIELKEKDKKLASFMMSELKKNNMLSEINDMLEESLNSPQEWKYKIQQSMNVVNRQINSQDDWKAFLKCFNNIHDGFLDNLKAKYPTLTMSELRLCTYLRMNLNTKEIATMLNISSTSVDVARHRLRKKLNLSNQVNLIQFLSDF